MIIEKEGKKKVRESNKEGRGQTKICSLVIEVTTQLAVKTNL
jgi:hypothetical protein